jgi:hypothetical protein
MKRIARFRPSPSMVVALAALVLAAGGVAFATIPDSGGTIHGCYSKINGVLRVVDSASDCRTGETPIGWNQQGPKGDPGPPGKDVTTNIGHAAFGQRESLLTVPDLFDLTLLCENLSSQFPQNPGPVIRFRVRLENLSTTTLTVVKSPFGRSQPDLAPGAVIDEVGELGFSSGRSWISPLGSLGVFAFTKSGQVVNSIFSIAPDSTPIATGCDFVAQAITSQTS